MYNKTRVVVNPTIQQRGRRKLRARDGIEVIYDSYVREVMGFFDRFKKKGEQQSTETKSSAKQDSSQPPAGKRIKKYTSDGKPIYE